MHENSSGAGRTADTRRAVALAAAGIFWNIAEAALAVSVGIMAGSLALVSYGAMSAVEIVPAAVVLIAALRLHRGRRSDRSHAALRRSAAFVAGVALLLLSLAVAHDAVSRLFFREASSPSPTGLLLAVLALLVKPFLAVLNRGSSALTDRAEGEGSPLNAVASALRPFLLLCGLAGVLLFNWRWADPAAALLMLPLMLRRGWRAVGASKDDAPSPSSAGRAGG